MPRPREYDRQTVIEKAADVFHRRGFEATGMAELVQATGLNTASMYKEFGSKTGLFEAALDQYRQTHIKRLIEDMEREPSLRALKAFLHKLETYAGSREFHGCLIMNNLAEKEQASRGTMRRVDDLCRRLESLVETCLRAAQRAGEVDSRTDPSQLAHTIVCFVHGVTLYARMENRRKNLPKIMGHVMSLIEG